MQKIITKTKININSRIKQIPMASPSILNKNLQGLCDNETTFCDVLIKVSQFKTKLIKIVFNSMLKFMFNQLIFILDKKPDV